MITWKVLQQTSETNLAAETTYEEISLGVIPKGLLMKTIHWQTKEGDTRGYSVNVILLEGYKLKDFE